MSKLRLKSALNDLRNGPWLGAHHAVQAFFRMQRAKGGPLGPEGPGWPRVERDEESGE